MPDNARRALIACICTVAVIIVIFVAYSGLRALEKKLLFPAGNTPFGFAFSSMQARLKGYEAISMPGSFGTVRYLSCPPPHEPKGIVVVYHGNAGTAADRVSSLVPRIADRGWKTVLVEYPGYADDPGDPSEKTILPNAVAAFDHATRDFDGPVVVFGRSLGSAVGTYVAARRQRKVGALMLISPFPSITHVVNTRLPLPVALLNYMIQSTFPAEEWAQDVAAPVTILHGTGDTLVPIKLGEKQAANFKRSKPRFITVEDVEHNDIHRVNAPLFWRAVDKAMADACATPFEDAIEKALSL